MQMLDQQTRNQISDLSEACGRYWELRGIAQNYKNEMQLELEHHFIQAAMDGKSPETVVGSNPAAFAEAWAREMRPRILRASALILPGLATALSVVSTTALVQHLLASTSFFIFNLFTAYLLASCGLGALLLPLEGFLAVHIRTRTRRDVLLAAVLVLSALVARSVGMRINWSMALFSWSWPLTFLLAALAVALSCVVCWWRASQEPTSSGRWAKLGRSLLTLASNVVVFDLFLGVSSVAICSACALTGRVF